MAGLLTLDDWHGLPRSDPRVSEQWSRYIPLLAASGVELFGPGKFTLERRPKKPRGVEKGVPRLCFAYEEEPFEGLTWRETDTRVTIKSSLSHPAEMSDRWVMVRVVKVGNEGIRHLKVLRRIKDSPKLSAFCLPMLFEISSPDITFAVFQYCFPVGISGSEPGFQTLGEALQFMTQATEAYASLHESGTCQRDPAYNNFVVRMAGPCQSTSDYRSRRGLDWRTNLPAKYYLIDFECAECWPLGTEGSTYAFRAVGLPHPRWFRPCAAEMLSGLPYEASRAEVFNLGLVFWELFKQVPNDRLQSIIESLLALSPESRPTAREANKTIEIFSLSLSEQQLSTSIPCEEWTEWQCHPNARKTPAALKVEQEERQRTEVITQKEQVS